MQSPTDCKGAKGREFLGFWRKIITSDKILIAVRRLGGESRLHSAYSIAYVYKIFIYKL